MTVNARFRRICLACFNGVAFGALLAILFAAPRVQADVTIRVDATSPRQVMEGFGATTWSLTFDNGRIDNVPSALRARALHALYNEVKLTMGNVLLGAFEVQNDNDEAGRFNWSGFEVNGVRVIRQTLVGPANAFGADGLFPSNHVDLRFRAWLRDLRHVNYQRYLDECAEFVLAGVLQWREVMGSEPRYHALFNEPLTGNGELQGGSLAEVIDIIKRAGARLRREGFTRVKFVVPSEETVSSSYDAASAILRDAEARQYVGAIAYHPYPYGSPYSYVPRLLATSGAGQPDRHEIEARGRLRDLAARYGVPLWMNEVSHAGVDPRTMDHVRGRAMHIHDELKYANASAYFGMIAMWDSKTHAEHFAGRSVPDILTEEDTIVLIENERDRITITGMGYAIGHYARWIARGATRIDAVSDDPLVQVTAFHDRAKNAVAVVLINNDATPRNVRVAFSGLRLPDRMRGEQSYARVRWQPFAAITPSDATSFSVQLPPHSVTSVGGALNRQ